MGSGVSDTTTYYTYTGVDPTDGTPTGLTPLGGALDNNNPVVNSASEPPTKDQFQAQEADAFYKDEFIIGYERYLSNEDSFSIRYINREVGVTLDDYCGFYSNPGYCTMINPGSGGSWSRIACDRIEDSTVLFSGHRYTARRTSLASSRTLPGHG